MLPLSLLPNHLTLATAGSLSALSSFSSLLSTVLRRLPHLSLSLSSYSHATATYINAL